MTGHSDPMLQSAERLCTTLDRIGDALVALDTETLLETEETLAQLLSALTARRAATDPAPNADEFERVVRRGRDALLRCRRLGNSFSSVARVRLQLCAGMETYGRGGEYAHAAMSGSAVSASV